MDDLKMHHDLLTKNEALEAENERLTEELRKARNIATDWKSKYNKLNGKKLTPSARARILITHAKDNGVKCVTDELVRIGKEVGLNYKTVRGLWYEK